MTTVPVSLSTRPGFRASAMPRVPAADANVSSSESMPTEGPLVDSFGRVHEDLRISVTDRCNLRCTYCMSEQGMTFLPPSALLSFDEIVRVASVARGLGVTSIRLTGGEPLVRTNLADLVAKLSSLGLEDLSITTNGMLLAPQVDRLAAAGLHRVNISCDSLRADRFGSIRRRGELSTVLHAMEAAEEAGLVPVKVNVVLLRGRNDDEILDFAQFARLTGRIVRFIEFMPLDAEGNWERDQLVPGDEVYQRISAKWPLRAVDEWPGAAPAERFSLPRRERGDRAHLECHPAVLWELQPAPSDGGRSHSELPVLRR